MGERSPLLDPNARGAFFGLSAIHTKYDMLRAVMEGVIFSQKHCLEVLRAMDLVPNEIIASGGGGTSPLWRQMMADMFGCNIGTVQNREGPALGAAILAGVGVGLYPSVEAACDAIITTTKQSSPNTANAEKYQPYYNLYLELYPALREQFAKLAGI